MMKKEKTNSILSQVVWWTIWAIMVVYCISLIVPVIWVLLSSLKSNSDFLLHPFELPREWKFENYLEAWTAFKVERVNKAGQRMLYGVFPMAFYSLVNTLGRSIISILSTMLVAYVLARYEFVGRNFIFNLGIVVMIVPIVGSLPSSMAVKRALGLHNNMLGLILTSPVTAFSGMNFLLMHGTFSKIPKEYSEAVYLDGGGHFTAMLRVIMPMAIPTGVALFVLSFIANWNDYNTFILWLPSYPSISIGVYLFQQQSEIYGVTTPIILSAMIIACIPTALIWIFMHKIIMEKFTVGGLKG